MEENSSSQMGRFRSQWLLEIRFPCRDLKSRRTTVAITQVHVNSKIIYERGNSVPLNSNLEHVC